MTNIVKDGFYSICVLTLTIIRTRVTRKKILVICATQLAGGLLSKQLNYFEVMLKVFEFSRV